MNHDTLIKCLQTSSTSIPICKLKPHSIEYVVVTANFLTDNQLAGILKSLPNPLPSRDFTYTCLP